MKTASASPGACASVSTSVRSAAEKLPWFQYAMPRLTRCEATEPMAAAASLNDPMLENLVGKWVLRGDIAGKHVIHSVEVQWVLAHEYIQIHKDFALEKRGRCARRKLALENR